MSAPVHPTMQELDNMAGVSRRLLFQAATVHRYGCRQLVEAAGAGLLAMKHCETLAKALPHDERREYLPGLPTMTPRQHDDLLALLKSNMMHRARRAKEQGGR